MIQRHVGPTPLAGGKAGQRHLYKHFPLTYDPQYWGMVFPLGMYTACTFQLSRAIDLPFLLVIPRYFIYIALVAWLTTFVGLLRNLGRLLTVSQPARQSGPSANPSPN